jgi:hypothetical protein
LVGDLLLDPFAEVERAHRERAVREIVVDDNGHVLEGGTEPGRDVHAAEVVHLQKANVLCSFKCTLLDYGNSKFRWCQPEVGNGNWKRSFKNIECLMKWSLEFEFNFL